MPTREKKLHTDLKLNNGQEVRCCEKVTFLVDGDTFVRLSLPYKGCVPLMRHGGGVKMTAVRPIPGEEQEKEPETVLAVETEFAKSKSGRAFKGFKSKASAMIGHHKKVAAKE